MKVVTFGELMLRLAPNGYLRIVQSNQLEATFGGAEANVAVSLANYGADVDFVTKLPKHEVGQAAVNSLRQFGVNTSNIVRGGDRVGIYYCEKGASQRPSKVIYDRAGSAIATAKHHARAFARDGGDLHRGVQEGEGKGDHYFRRPQLPQETVDARTGEQDDDRALQVH